jgi:hypothetical protein
VTPESRWWPLCERCLLSGTARKVARFEAREVGSSVVFTAHCHGETEQCTVALADARMMLSETAGLAVSGASEPALRLAPNLAFPSIA